MRPVTQGASTNTIAEYMLTKLREFIETLNKNDIRYCHWKSNLSLAQALSGDTDVDLLVYRNDADCFRLILSQLCFRPAVNNDGLSFPSVVHYFALDEESGLLVHVHAYFRVITGESLAKNYRLPIEEMILQNTREVGSVPLPVKSAELVVFTLRIMLKHTSLVELVLLARDWKHVRREVEWLLEENSLDAAVDLVNCWLPSLDTDLFVACVRALRDPAPLLRRINLGFRMRAQLRIYARHSAIRARLDGAKKFSTMALRRLTHAKRGMALQSGGAVIAFVGPEATGKSTLLAEVSHWLGEYFAVEQVHAGKPKSTPLSIAPNLFLPALRSMLPSYRSGHVETQYGAKDHSESSEKVYPLIFAIRSALLGYDRRSLLTRAYRQAANGTIVLCDRYPSLTGGAPDSPQLSHMPVAADQYPIRYRLARIEQRMYREIPSPDLVISLTVPVEVAVVRNATRGKYEPEDYVRLRHVQSANLNFGDTPVYEINTDQPLDDVVLDVKKAVWNTL